MLVNSEKQAIKYVKKLGAFHDSIMSVATLSKEGTTFLAKESFLSFSLTPSKGDLGLIKNLCSVVDCIQQVKEHYSLRSSIYFFRYHLNRY